MYIFNEIMITDFVLWFVFVFWGEGLFWFGLVFLMYRPEVKHTVKQFQ